jgi:hypothetical protein
MNDIINAQALANLSAMAAGQAIVGVSQATQTLIDGTIRATLDVLETSANECATLDEFVSQIQNASDIIRRKQNQPDDGCRERERRSPNRGTN